MRWGRKRMRCLQSIRQSPPKIRVKDRASSLVTQFVSELTMRHACAHLISSLLMLCAFTAHAAEPAYQVTDKQALAGDVKWDYLNFDASSKRLFITRGDHVDVYDTAIGRVVAPI